MAAVWMLSKVNAESIENLKPRMNTWVFYCLILFKLRYNNFYNLCRKFVEWLFGK